MTILAKMIEKTKVFFGLENPEPKAGDVWYLPAHNDMKSVNVQVKKVEDGKVIVHLSNGKILKCDVDVFKKTHVFQYTSAQVAGNTQFIPSPLL